MESSTLCFTCAKPITDPPRFNALEDGEPCPACRMRVMDALPAPFPSESGEPAAPPARGIVEPSMGLPRDGSDLSEPA